MTRKPRIHYPGAVYHVILRGNAGEPIFFEDCDRYRFYPILQHTAEKFGCRIHGFCLMTNHAHFIMQVGDMPLSRIMQNISQRYTKWVNYSQGRTGHIFQGRYKALLLGADEYLLEIVRYIHLNPVRAGMVATPEDYLWSGHRAYLGMENIPWLNSDWTLLILSNKLDSANHLRQLAFSINVVVMAVCRRYRITVEQLTAPGKARPYSEARALLALLVNDY